MKNSARSTIARANDLLIEPRTPQRKSGLLLAGAAVLAASAALVQYRTKKAERENPPQGKFIKVDGVRLHYLERGEGAPLVIFHGNGSMAREVELSGLLDLASEKYRVIVFDRPGYGYSERPRTKLWDPVAQAKLLYRALQYLGVDKPIVAGHSWGALVAIALALEQPQYVRKLMLLSGYYFPVPRLDIVLVSPPAIPIIGDLLRYTVSPLIGRLAWPLMLRKLFLPASTSQRFKKDYPVWIGLRPSQIRAASAETAMMLPAAYSLSKRYHELKLPIAIMAGAGDLHVLPKLHSERLHRMLPQSELILVPHVGHMLTHSAPERVLAAIENTVVAEQENPTEWRHDPALFRPMDAQRPRPAL